MLHQNSATVGLQRCSSPKPTFHASPKSAIPQRCVRRYGKANKDEPDQSNKEGFLSSMLPMDNTIKISRVEAARKYFRTVYDFPQWEKHRKQTRLIDRLLTIPQSHVLTNIGPSLAWVTGVSGLLVGYMYAYDSGILPDGFPTMAANPSAQAFISTTSIALSLLLVFRTNTSYARWDEARKMWGGLLNRSRDLMRQGVTMIPAGDTEAKKALARWTTAFSRVLRIHFQPEVTVDKELAHILEPEELEQLKKAPHRPVFALHCISQIIQNCGMDPIHQMNMSTNITFFQDVLGGCERLLRAPIPVSYTRHTARFLFLWLTILPFSLYPNLGVWTIPVVFAVTGVLAGIEEIGVQCEEPFGILPLDVICNRIEADVTSTLKEDGDVKALLFSTMKREAVMSSPSAKNILHKMPPPSVNINSAFFPTASSDAPIDWNQVDYESLMQSERDLARLEELLAGFSDRANTRLEEITAALGDPVSTRNY